MTFLAVPVVLHELALAFQLGLKHHLLHHCNVRLWVLGWGSACGEYNCRVLETSLSEMLELVVRMGLGGLTLAWIVMCSLGWRDVSGVQ